jgi:uncharacterized protein (TIRG00374 family)
MHYKKYLKPILQFLFILGIFFYLKPHIQVKNILTLIKYANCNFVLLAFLTLVIQLVICAYRWKILLGNLSYKIHLWPSLGAVSISSLINTSLPVLIGGDLIKVWVGDMYKIKKNHLFISIVLDRVLNLSGQSFFVLISWLIFIYPSSKLINTNPITEIGLYISSIILAGFIVLLFLQPISKYFPLLLKKIISPFLHLSHQLIQLFKCLKLNFHLIFIILLGHGLLFISIYLITRSMGLYLPITKLFTPISIALLIASFPITPGGWGIRESVVILALQQFNVPPQVALTISIIFGINLTLASIPPSLAWYIDYQTKKFINNKQILKSASL